MAVSLVNVISCSKAGTAASSTLLSALVQRCSLVIDPNAVDCVLASTDWDLRVIGNRSIGGGKSALYACLSDAGAEKGVQFRRRYLTKLHNGYPVAN